MLVVDGASTDASADVAAAHGARWIQAENNGLGYLYNRGAREATSEYVLFANNDIALDKHCLELCSAMRSTDGIRFAADPRQMDWDGTGSSTPARRLQRAATSTSSCQASGWT